MRVGLFLLFSMLLFGSEIRWAADYEDALARSRQTGKPVYLFISAPECPWCEKLERTTLKEPQVIAMLNSRFIPLHLERGFDDIPSRFASRPVPHHYVFLDAKGYFYEDVGYFSKDIFMLMLQTTLKELR